MMTRKQYIAIAKIFKTYADTPIKDRLIRDLMIYFTEDNPKFNWGKFKEACLE